MMTVIIMTMIIMINTIAFLLADSPKQYGIHTQDMYIKITLDYDYEDDDGSYDDECGYCKSDRGDAGNSNNTAVVPRLLPT